MKRLNEEKRNQLINRSKASKHYVDQSKGKNRFERRLKSKVANSVSRFNSIDMDKLFKQGILDLDIDVHGETDDYLVKLSFTGFLDELRGYMPKDPQEKDFNLAAIERALINCLNKDDILIHCTCPDWKFRMAYWCTKKGINSIPGEQNSNGQWIANPGDDMGHGCKHVMAALSNRSWIVKVASAIRNYVNFLKVDRPKLYADVLYPIIFGRPYEDDVQLDMFDKINGEKPDELIHDTDTLDTANKWAKTKNQFKKGNQQGVKFAKKDQDNPINGQKEFDIDSIE